MPEVTTTPALAVLLLTDAQVGELLQVTADCVRNLHRTRQLPGVLIGRSLRWRPSDVRAFVKTLDPGGGGE